MAPSLLGRRATALTAFLSAATGSAFQSSQSPPTTHAQRRPTTVVALMSARYPPPYPPYPPPFPGDPYLNPYFPQFHPQFYPPFHPGYPPPPPQYRPQRGPGSARYAAALDVEAEVVPEPDAGPDDRAEEDAWAPDRERARARGPLRSAAAAGAPGGAAGGDVAPGGEAGGDERAFVGRRPGQPVNRRGPASPGGDAREQHVVLDEYDDRTHGFFQQAPPGTPPPPRRPGPSVYTREEEELIAAMGGRGGPRSTQEFAGLGTMSKNSKGPPRRPAPRDGARPADPQQRNYNPEQDYNPVLPPPPKKQFREEGYLGDCTLREISSDYSVPIPWLADVLVSWGVPVPVDPRARLGDLVTGEQAFAVLEAVHTLDVAGLHARYGEDDLATLCDYYDIDLKAAYEFCVGRGWALPFGVRTFLRVEQEEELLEVLAGGPAY